MDKFLAGVGRALIFKGNDLIGVAETLTDSTFDFSITSEEVRGGAGNALYGKYFHDSALNVTLTDAMFKLEYIAASLGVNIEAGGLSMAEEELTTAAGGVITPTHTPVAFDGSVIGWYKLPSESNWNVGTFTGGTMTIAGADAGVAYCIKYQYQNENARSIVIPTQYVPSELHVVIMNDLFAGGIGAGSDTAKIGRLITDIPRLQMDGSQTLSLSSSGASTVSLSGSALAVTNQGQSCEMDSYYGTMTEEIFGDTWQQNVVALAIENGDMELSVGDNDALIVRAVFGSGMASQRKDNSNFTFTSSAVGVASVNSDTGVVTGEASGSAYITVALTGYPNVAPAIAEVTVNA